MNKRVWVPLLSACMFFAIGGSLILHTNAEEIQPPVTLKELYEKNERVELPQKKITIDGVSYDTTAMVIYPNGSVYTVTNGAFQTTGAGLYSVVYSTVVDGKYYEERDTFTVKERTFTVGDNKSSIFYGNHEHYATDKSGIVLQLASNDTFRFNQIVDLNDYNSESIFSFFTTPTTLGTEDARYVKVTFTDIYDSENTLTIEARRHSSSGDWAHLNTYIVAYANGQDKVGIESDSKNAKTLINGAYYEVFRNSDYGAYIDYSLSGWLKDGEQIGDREIELYIDYETKTVSAGTKGSRKVVTYLDNPLLYSNPWNGFTTGEVFVSVSASSYNSSTFGCVVTKIGDCDLSQEVLEETSTPLISVDFAEYDENGIPQAVVGIPYNIYDASAWDFYDGSLPVTTQVYYNFYGENAYQVPVVNGKFTPTVDGWYTIVYTATNKFGKAERYLVDVQTLDTQALLGVEITDRIATAMSGTTVEVAHAYAVKNAFGKSNIEITATLKSNPEVSYKVDKDTLCFTPYYAGVYEISFKASDYLVTVEEKFEIEISANPKPFIEGAANLPKYLIAGNTYKLPTEIYGYDLSSGVPVKKRCQITVQEDAKSAVTIAENGVYTVGNATTAKVVYSVSSGTTTMELPYEIPVVSVKNNYGEIEITKYFISSDNSTSVTADDDYVYFDFAKNGTVEFINPLTPNLFELGFMIKQGNFDTVDIYLSSVEAKNETVKISIKGENTSIGVYINDKYVGEFSGTFEHFVSSAMSMQYQDGMITIDSVTVPVTTYLSGEKFEGFHGSIVWNMGLSGVRNASKLAIVKVNNQYLYNLTADFIEPQLSIKRMVGERERNEKITISSALAYDVLTGYTTVSYSITHPNGNFVKAENGVVLDGTQNAELDYTFVVNEFGKYVVKYQAVDGNNNTLNYTYTISCADSVLPEVSLTRYEMTAKVGKIVIPKVTASDNITAQSDLEIVVTVMMPSGKMARVNGDSFDATMLGKYIVFYSVFDEMGHFAQVTCVITVNE